MSLISLLSLCSKFTLLCFVILALDPVNFSLLPADAALGCVSRGTGERPRDASSGKYRWPFSCAGSLTRRCSSVVSSSARSADAAESCLSVVCGFALRKGSAPQPALVVQESAALPFPGLILGSSGQEFRGPHRPV